MLHAITADLDPHPRTYLALRTYLEALAAPSQRAAALLRFQWVLLDDGGYRPELLRDVHSNTPLPEQATYTFDPRHGGLTQQHGVNAGDWRVRQSTVALLRQLASDEPIESMNTKTAADTVNRANRLLCVYLRSILDRELPTMRYVLG